jgi:hypothetical protein
MSCHSGGTPQMDSRRERIADRMHLGKTLDALELGSHQPPPARHRRQRIRPARSKAEQRRAGHDLVPLRRDHAAGLREQDLAARVGQRLGRVEINPHRELAAGAIVECCLIGKIRFNLTLPCGHHGLAWP